MGRPLCCPRFIRQRHLPVSYGERVYHQEPCQRRQSPEVDGRRARSVPERVLERKQSPQTSRPTCSARAATTRSQSTSEGSYAGTFASSTPTADDITTGHDLGQSSAP